MFLWRIARSPCHRCTGLHFGEKKGTLYKHCGAPTGNISGPIQTSFLFLPAPPMAKNNRMAVSGQRHPGRLSASWMKLFRCSYRPSISGAGNMRCGILKTNRSPVQKCGTPSPVLTIPWSRCNLRPWKKSRKLMRSSSRLGGRVITTGSTNVIPLPNSFPWNGTEKR